MTGGDRPARFSGFGKPLCIASNLVLPVNYDSSFLNLSLLNLTIDSLSLRICSGIASLRSSFFGLVGLVDVSPLSVRTNGSVPVTGLEDAGGASSFEEFVVVASC